MAGTQSLGTVLVAGGSGWLGSAVVERLQARAAELGVKRILTADTRPPRGKGSSAAEHRALDVSSASAVEELFAHIKPDTVLNVAAVIDLRPEAGQDSMEATNHVGATNLVEAAARHGARAFVHVSTLDVAWTTGDMVLHEANPPEDLQTNSVVGYVRTKARGEASVLAAATSQKDLSIVVLRPAHIFGSLDQGDPVAGYLRTVPPLRLGSASARISLVSLGATVDGLIAAAMRAGELHGKTLTLKEFDSNFSEFYQTHLLQRSFLPLPRVPATLILLVASLVDFWFLAVTRVVAVLEHALGGKRLPWWCTLLCQRHPTYCFSKHGVGQALMHLTVEDRTAWQALRLSPEAHLASGGFAATR